MTTRAVTFGMRCDMERKWKSRRSGKNILHKLELPGVLPRRQVRHVDVYEIPGGKCVLTYPSGFIRDYLDLEAAKRAAEKYADELVIDAQGDRLVVFIPIGTRHVDVRQHPSKRFKVTYMGVTRDGLERHEAEAKIGAYVMDAAAWENMIE